MFNFYSLKAKLSFFAGVAILLMLGISSFFYIRTAMIVKNEVERFSKATFEQVDRQLNSFFEQSQKLALLFAYSNSIESYLTQTEMSQKRESFLQIENLFVNAKTINGRFKDLLLISNNSQYLSISGYVYNQSVIQNMVSMSTNNSFSDNHFTPKFLFNQSGENTMTILYPVNGKNNYNFGKLLGYIGFVLDTNELVELLISLKYTPGTDMFLVNDKYSIIYTTLKERDASKEKILSQLKNGIKPMIVENQKKYQINYKALNIHNLYILSVIPEEELFGQLNSTKNILLGLVVLNIAIMSTLIFIITRGITSPIGKLLESIKKIKNGNIKVRVRLNERSEIGAIANEFDEMMEQIHTLTNKIINNQARLYEIEIAKNEMEIMALQYQINPHFLYNTLACMGSIAIYYDIKEISSITKAMAKIYEYTIRMPENVTVRQEITNINYYMDIQKIRMPNRIALSIDIPSELWEMSIVKLCLQPVVENAVEHGIGNKVNGGVIYLQGRVNRDKINIIIEDNGVGMDEGGVNSIRERLKQSPLVSEGGANNRLGLVNVNKRLKLKFGNDYGVSIESTINVGTKVTITLPKGENANVKSTFS